MTKEDVIKMIQKAFTKMYGFAPMKKDIIFLECVMHGKFYDSVGFRCGAIGYTWTCHNMWEARMVERAECYDLKEEV